MADPWAEMYAQPAAVAKPAAPAPVATPAAAPAAAATPAPTPAKVETATQTLARKFPVGGTPYEAPTGTHSVATANIGSPSAPLAKTSSGLATVSEWNAMAEKSTGYADGGAVGMNTGNANALMHGNMMDRHNNDNRLPKHAHHKGRGHG